jgi:type IV secretion system protein VirB9
MKSRQLFVVGLLGIILGVGGSTATLAQDSRLRTVEFNLGLVVPVYVQQGYAVQIVLGTNEHIEAAGSGVNSHCEDPAAQWCIVALKGEHDVYVNVHPGATMTNLFVQTDRHNYSFDLIALQASGKLNRKSVYRIQFTYPDDAMQRLASVQKEERAEREKKVLEDRLAQPPLPRNWNYTMQVMPGGEGIAPTAMYDDGRFTYLRFPNNLEIPTIYMVSDDGDESVVQWHVDSDVVVVHRVAKRLVLRDGSAVIGLWNESYDPNGVPPDDGVTVPGVSRVIVKRESPRQTGGDNKQAEPAVQRNSTFNVPSTSGASAGSAADILNQQMSIRPAKSN